MNVTLPIFYLVHVAWRSECAGTIVYFPSSYLLQFRTMIDWCQEIAWMDTRGQELGQIRSTRRGLASTIIRYVLAVLWNLSESISFAQKLCTSPSRVWDELAVLLLVVTLPCFISFNTGKYTGLLILADKACIGSTSVNTVASVELFSHTILTHRSVDTFQSSDDVLNIISLCNDAYTNERPFRM